MINILRTIKVTVFVVAITLFTACGQSGATNQKTISEIRVPAPFVASSDSLFAIIKYDSNSHHFFKNAIPTSLTELEINKIDEILNQSVLTYNTNHQEYTKELKSRDEQINDARFLINISKYARQYVPIVNQLGEKEVWVNCFCQSSNDNWKKQIVIVNDGGLCYFNLKINLSTLQYYEFNVNGEA